MNMGLIGGYSRLNRSWRYDEEEGLCSILKRIEDFERFFYRLALLTVLYPIE